MAKSAERKRRYRARQRMGAMVVPVEAGAEFQNAVAAACGLTDAEALSRERLALAIRDLADQAIAIRLRQRREIFWGRVPPTGPKRG